MTKRISILLSLLLIFSVLPIKVFADDTNIKDGSSIGVDKNNQVKNATGIGGKEVTVIKSPSLDGDGNLVSPNTDMNATLKNPDGSTLYMVVDGQKTEATLAKLQKAYVYDRTHGPNAVSKSQAVAEAQAHFNSDVVLASKANFSNPPCQGCLYTTDKTGNTIQDYEAALQRSSNEADQLVLAKLQQLKQDNPEKYQEIKQKMESGKTTGALILEELDIPTPIIPPEKTPKKTTETEKEPDETCDGVVFQEYINKRTESAGSGHVEGVVSVRATLMPLNINLRGLPSEQISYWNETHVPQYNGPIKTAYGEYLDDNRALLASLLGMGKSGGLGEASNYRQAWEKFQAGAEAAIAEGVPEITIDFNSQNKIGFARGGVWTFTEFRKSASVSANHNQDYYDRQECEEYKVPYTRYETTYYSDGTTSTTSYTDYKIKYRIIIAERHVMKDGNYTQENIAAVESPGYTPYKSYQILNVRCNETEFDRVVSATGSEVKARGPESSSAKSPTVMNTISTVYNRLVDKDFFYNGKDCDPVYSCTGEVNTGASNDSANNVQDKGEHTNGLYGAQSDGKSSSKFSLFRDNISKEIRNDVWWLYPSQVRAGAWNFDTKKAAEATFITMYTKATPDKDLFNLEDENKNVVLTGTQIAAGDNALLYNSQVNVFNWRASWASERAFPHKMNTRYAYKPKSITKQTPTVLSREGVKSVEDKEEILDMYCDVLYNTTERVVPIIKNQPKPEKYKKITDFVEDNRRNLIVQFIKSSAE